MRYSSIITALACITMVIGRPYGSSFFHPEKKGLINPRIGQPPAYTCLCPADAELPQTTEAAAPVSSPVPEHQADGQDTALPGYPPTSAADPPAETSIMTTSTEVEPEETETVVIPDRPEETTASTSEVDVETTASPSPTTTASEPVETDMSDNGGPRIIIMVAAGISVSTGPLATAPNEAAKHFTLPGLAASAREMKLQGSFEDGSKTKEQECTISLKDNTKPQIRTTYLVWDKIRLQEDKDNIIFKCSAPVAKSS